MDCSKCKTISGPTLIYRLEHKRFGGNEKEKGRKKIFYNFGDHHLPLDTQTECSRISPIIDQYLDSTFRTTKKELDFFVEFRYELSSEATLFHNPGNLKYSGKYIDRVEQMIEGKKKIDKKLSPKSYGPGEFVDVVVGNDNKQEVNDVVIVKDEWPKVRFHLFDFRDVMKKDLLSNDVDHLLWMSSFQKSKIDSIIENLQWYVDNVLGLFKMTPKELSEYKPPPALTQQNELSKKELISKDNLITTRLFYLIKKFKTKSAHPNISRILIDLFDDYVGQLQQNIEKIIVCAKQLQELETKFPHHRWLEKRSSLVDLNTYEFDFNSYQDYNELNKLDLAGPIKTMIANLGHLNITHLAHITDLFLLKRFLDKDYINLCISYTGQGHSIHYLYVLVKYFGFKITNIDYSDISIDELTVLVKNETNVIKACNKANFHVAKPWLTQCVDISTFPKLFS